MEVHEAVQAAVLRGGEDRKKIIREVKKIAKKLIKQNGYDAVSSYQRDTAYEQKQEAYLAAGSFRNWQAGLDPDEDKDVIRTRAISEGVCQALEDFEDAKQPA